MADYKKVLFIVVLMVCIVLVHSTCRPRCRLHLAKMSLPTCQTGKECKESYGGIHRCFDKTTDCDEPATCLQKLNRREVDHCMLCPTDGCSHATVTDFGTMYSTDVEVTNTANCDITEMDHDSVECERECNSKDCIYFWSNFSKCKLFSRNCEIRATGGSTPHHIKYRNCGSNTP
ncbi:uncharacterized protein LOC123555646 [Mercenaria mercenaria]|uniref:uncharacterized protein LOC123555646 n=1 Tax=Mercenaria mercenaria TaxID=6596 RepID=UPI001E1DBD36|nr:uncharacterized protein LOC123555646 [Mercenaria mercenaria]